jgi:phosphatidylserine/phosphatidylglycerophosphate/cardiolipin synthase-like enzyme
VFGVFMAKHYGARVRAIDKSKRAIDINIKVPSLLFLDDDIDLCDVFKKLLEEEEREGIYISN